MAGWVKLHRELLDKPIWFESTPEQIKILMTLLLMANHKEKEWEFDGKKYKAKPGQFVTSLEAIRKKCGKGISIKNIRTALLRFENYEFLASQSTNRNRLITIVNWEVYQQNDDEPASEPASNRQATGKQPATNKNVKNVKNEKKVIKTIRPKVAPSDTDLENARLLFDGIKSNYEKFKEPDIVKWGNILRLIREQDEQTDDKLTKYLIKWSQTDKFYKTIIRSAQNFRDHYHAMYLKAKEQVDKQRHLQVIPGKGNSKKEEIERLKEKYRNEDL